MKKMCNVLNLFSFNTIPFETNIFFERISVTTEKCSTLATIAFPTSRNGCLIAMSSSISYTELGAWEVQ